MTRPLNQQNSVQSEEDERWRVKERERRVMEGSEREEKKKRKDEEEIQRGIKKKGKDKKSEKEDDVNLENVDKGKQRGLKR